ncbi:MAG: hypothetical protein BAA02_05580 [Paenibacillaceae bacterium ZCTH02-B3]|nr:MAG: hypothetical protein BAA02_05580 [Paenibacillaceae bacterium ZCTH02-B3]
MHVKLGLGSYLFRWAIGTPSFRPARPLNAFGLLEKARELGVGLVQFADNLPLHRLSDDELKALKKKADAYGIELENGMEGVTAERLLEYLRISRLIGARLLRVSFHAPDIHPTLEEGLQAIKDVLPQFAEAGVSIAIENHFTISSPDLVRLVEKANSPFVGICLDVANSIRQKEWPEETVAMLAPYALSLHLKDYRLETHPDQLGVYIAGAPLGEGLLDAGEVLKTLSIYRTGFSVILEQWCPPADTEEETLRRETEWIRKGLNHARSVLLRFMETTVHTGSGGTKHAAI